MIKVMIEQHCQPGKEKQLRDLLIELRTMAMKQPGYISGETLRDLINPSLFKVISTWSNLKTWQTWETSQQRLLIEEKINSVTTGGRNLCVFNEDYNTNHN